MKILFCGTPQFAVPTLERLLNGSLQIELVITNPDEASGRGYAVTIPPVKQAALDARLPVFQPRSLKDPFTRAFLTEYRPDAIVVVAYGHIIPPWMINLPRLGCFNLHASLLPKYRGAAPIPWAIVRGEQVTGVTTMKIDPGLDTGDILLEREAPIRPDDTAETLAGRLSRQGAELMAETLFRLEQGNLVARPQDHSQATHAPMLKKEDGRIDWSRPAEEIERRVRGFNPWPGAYSNFRGKGIHVWKAALAPPETRRPAAEAGLEPGLLFVAHGRLLAVAGEGTSLELVEVQLEGRRRLSGRDFLNGVRLQPDDRLG